MLGHLVSVFHDDRPRTRGLAGWLHGLLARLLRQ
jgi:hypothetical protein